MSELSRPARAYLYAVWSVAALLLVGLLHWLPPSQPAIWLASWLAGYALADFFEVNFETNGNRIGMTLAEAFTIFLVPTAGVAAVYIIAASTLIVEITRKRPWHKALFNLASRTITTTIMVGIYTLIHEPGVATFSTPREICAFIAIALAFYISSTLLVGSVVALASNTPVQSIYRDSYQLVQWIHLLTLPIGALMAAHWNSNFWMLVFDLLILLIAQRSFVMVAQLHEESHRRQQLADERERLLKELQAHQEELIRTSKLSALGTFASGIAHEFNNLLTAIQGQAQIGIVTNDLDEMHESLDLIVKACRRGSSITKGLLTFARQRETQQVMCQLGELIDDTLKMIEYDFEKEHIRIVRQLSAVPPTLCDPGQMVQVFLNMLTNARDAMHELGGGTITLSMHHDSESIFITFADTGSGMPSELQQQIFQPFITTKGNKGTGLGLAICYGIIESHGGTISVTSSLGQGTTMLIRIPLVERHEPAIRLSQHDASRIAAATPHEPARI